MSPPGPGAKNGPDLALVGLLGLVVLLLVADRVVKAWPRGPDRVAHPFLKGETIPRPVEMRIPRGELELVLDDGRRFVPRSMGGREEWVPAGQPDGPRLGLVAGQALRGRLRFRRPAPAPDAGRAARVRLAGARVRWEVDRGGMSDKHHSDGFPPMPPRGGSWWGMRAQERELPRDFPAGSWLELPIEADLPPDARPCVDENGSSSSRVVLGISYDDPEGALPGEWYREVRSPFVDVFAPEGPWSEAALAAAGLLPRRGEPDPPGAVQSPAGGAP